MVDDEVEVGEYLDIYCNCPKFKDNGICTRIQKPNDRFDFHRNAWNFVTDIMSIVDPKSLIDPNTGEEIKFKANVLSRIIQNSNRKKIEKKF